MVWIVSVMSCGFDGLGYELWFEYFGLSYGLDSQGSELWSEWFGV